jgi:hypothetical protein
MFQSSPIVFTFQQSRMEAVEKKWQEGGWEENSPCHVKCDRYSSSWGTVEVRLWELAEGGRSDNTESVLLRHKWRKAGRWGNPRTTPSVSS